MKYPSGIVKEVAVYQCGTQGSICAVTVVWETSAQRTTYGIYLVRDLERNHGLEQCLEDPNIQWSLVSKYWIYPHVFLFCFFNFKHSCIYFWLHHLVCGIFSPLTRNQTWALSSESMVF